MRHVTFAIFSLSLLLASLGAQPALAQFGVDSDPVPKAPAAPASAPVAPAPPPAEPSVISVEDALATFNEYRAAALNNDSEYLLSILAEPLSSAAAEVIANEGLLGFVNGGEPITKWKARCVACWEDDDEGAMCALDDRKYLPSKYNDKYYPNLYVFSKVGDTTYISSEMVFRGDKRARQIEKAMKKNDRDCDLDALTLQIQADNPDSTKEGASSLMRGIGSVLKALGT